MPTPLFLSAFTQEHLRELQLSREVGRALEHAAHHHPEKLPASLLDAYTPLRLHYFSEASDVLAELSMSRAVGREIGRLVSHAPGALPEKVTKAFVALQAMYAAAIEAGDIS